MAPCSEWPAPRPPCPARAAFAPPGACPGRCKRRTAPWRPCQRPLTMRLPLPAAPSRPQVHPQVQLHRGGDCPRQRLRVRPGLRRHLQRREPLDRCVVLLAGGLCGRGLASGGVSGGASASPGACCWGPAWRGCREGGLPASCHDGGGAADSPPLPSIHHPLCPQVNFINTVSRGLKAGTVWVNCYNVYESAVPFGGYKSSGERPCCGRAPSVHATRAAAGAVHPLRLASRAA